jgi:hypothetical protein
MTVLSSVSFSNVNAATGSLKSGKLLFALVLEDMCGIMNIWFKLIYCHVLNGNKLVQLQDLPTEDPS